MGQVGRLVIVSNRVPSISVPTTEEEKRFRSVGGLVSAVQAALEQRGGLWFGWSGNTGSGKALSTPTIAQAGPFHLVTIDLSREEVNLFYTAFSNRILWPLLHSFPDRVAIRRDSYRAYRRVNQRFAASLYPLLRDGDLVWVHDYHLIFLGYELRRLGWRGRVGFFLHIPFPPPEVFTALPWAGEMLGGLLFYDLLGLHTSRYAHNLLDSLVTELGGVVTGGVFFRRDQSLQAEAYPIGTDPDAFEYWSRTAQRGQAARSRLGIPRGHKVLLGVDRLDYTKGIPHRLQAFQHLLERYPSLRGKLTYIQISVPSRSRVPEYVKEKERVELLVGSINGHFSEAGWTPVHYLYRSYSQRELASFYREADVCLVTPLRDGMNLVAKEYVASQGDNPGALLLSKFCGAAETMREAIMVNPYDIEGTADAIHEALTMPPKERRRRWDILIRDVRTHTAQRWAEAFLTDLAQPATAEKALNPKMASTA